jgi:crotonobetainyl-CoA:carnitine CoA-transferase CaiB-like acyl-CoA transferase
MAVPAAFSDTPGSVRLLWPALGEHTAQVLGEAGMSEAEIRAVLEEADLPAPAR